MIAGFVDKPFASSIIYATSMAAWLFLALVFVHWIPAGLLAGLTLLVGFVATVLGVQRMRGQSTTGTERARPSVVEWQPFHR